MVEEDIYGNRKKLEFIISSTNNYLQSENLKKTDVRILDVGCGNGTAAAFPVASLGFNVIGIDTHKPSIEYAKSKCSLPNLSFECKDVNSLTIEKKFDAIICKDIIEHLTNPVTIINKLHQILKDDGILIISIPNGYGPFEIERYIITKIGLLKLANFLIRGIKRLGLVEVNQNKEEIPYNLECGHVQFYTMAKFRELMREANFEIIKIENGSFLGSDFSGILLGRSKKFIKWNVDIANILPHWAVSTWCFAAKKKI